jgi:hypothetical protein
MPDRILAEGEEIEPFLRKWRLPMTSDPSSLVVAVVFLAVALLAAVVISIKLTDRKGDVLHGGYIKRDNDATLLRLASPFGGDKMTKIIFALGLYTMGLATGYIWRDRISQARHAKRRQELKQSDAKS